MKDKIYFQTLQKRIIYSLREYPLQVLGAGLIAVLFSIVLIIGLILPHRAHGQSSVANQLNSNEQKAETNIHQPLTESFSYANTVEKVAPAVVTVRSEKKVSPQISGSPFNDEIFRQFFGDKIPRMNQQPQIERGLGSGVIVDSNGTILTNNHVVDGASQVKIDLPDKRTFTAKVVGTDPSSDLAVLKIEAANLPTLPLGDSDKVRVGDVVLAVGNPLGLRQTVTSGIISAKGRQTGLSDGSFEDFLQTDAPINQGNSGGALVNLNGELIGINSQILSPSGGNIGIGFAIPSNMAKSVMSQLLKDGKVHRGRLGVGIQDVTSALAENFGLKNVRGVLINSVSPSSPAENAGLKQGDVIVSLNGSEISDGNELRNKIAQTTPGTEVTIGFIRAGSEQTAKAVLDEFKPTKDGNESEQRTDEPASGKLGLMLQPVTPQIAAQLGIKNSAGGLVVTEVESGSPADDAGIVQGDVILEVNRQTVNSLTEVKNALEKSKNKTVLLLIDRHGQTLYVTAAL